MKDKLLKLIAAKEARKAELLTKSNASENVEELRSINAELDTLNGELNELRDMVANIDAPAPAQRSGFNPLSVVGAKGGENGEQRAENKLGTMEYRTQFMNYVRTGVMGDQLQKRQNDQNESSDLGVLLPTTVVQEIIKGVEKVYGQLYAKVKKTNIKGGVKYPIGSFGATFKRITETTVSERQNGGSVTGYVEFTYNIGEIRLAQTLLASVLSVPVFESELSKVIVEAYVKAMDTEILIGNATNNECAGIITEAKKSSGSRVIAANVIEFTEADMKDWTKWQTKLFAAIPLSMRKERPEFVMTANTFESNIETLQDSNGQPVARNIYNPVTGDETARFKGREVTFVEPVDGAIENFNDAGNGDYFGMYWVPEKAYAINTNLEFSVTRYFDNETNQWVDKAIVINDGKILDPKYLYLLKKKA